MRSVRMPLTLGVCALTLSGCVSGAASSTLGSAAAAVKGKLITDAVLGTWTCLNYNTKNGEGDPRFAGTLAVGDGTWRLKGVDSGANVTIPADTSGAWSLTDGSIQISGTEARYVEGTATAGGVPATLDDGLSTTFTWEYPDGDSGTKTAQGKASYADGKITLVVTNYTTVCSKSD